jgi:hypothetical protein
VKRMKKTKQPGDNISLKTKKTEDPAVMNWINAQSNLMDSLRYLIENEIVQNGLRNLQTFVPIERNILTSALPFQDSALNVPFSEAFPTTASAAVLTREIGEAREEVSVAKSVQLDSPEQPIPSVYRTDAKLPVTIERAESEPSASDDIDDDDIEAWI